LGNNILFPFQLKTAREAAQYGLTGSALGALFTAGFAWKYSRSLHGNLLLFILLKPFTAPKCDYHMQASFLL
jgi:hypothetical protein